MVQDSTLKSLLIGRLGAALNTVASALLLFFGTDVAPADIQAVTGAGTEIINSGFMFGSLITGAAALIQTLISKYKPRAEVKK